MFEGGVRWIVRRRSRTCPAMRRWAPPIDLSRAHILAAGDPLEFTHPLLRAAVYGGLPRRRKAALHRGAARSCSPRACRARRSRRTCC